MNTGPTKQKTQLALTPSTIRLSRRVGKRRRSAYFDLLFQRQRRRWHAAIRKIAGSGMTLAEVLAMVDDHGSEYEADLLDPSRMSTEEAFGIVAFELLLAANQECESALERELLKATQKRIEAERSSD